MTAQLSREWLLERINSPEQFTNSEEAIEAFKLALAGMDSEPVYQLLDMTWYDTDKEQYEYQTSNGRTGRIRYTAPPAPVAVPDERTAFNAWNNEENLPIAGVGAKNAAWLGWQARAAMLKAGPVTGWIKCSERMPEVGDEYYLTHSNAGVDVSYFCGGSFSDEYATHWMPLPAAPEQEV